MKKQKKKPLFKIKQKIMKILKFNKFKIRNNYKSNKQRKKAINKIKSII